MVDEDFWNQSDEQFDGSTEASRDNEEVAWPALQRALGQNVAVSGKARILDFGCGAGQLAHLLASGNRYEVVGLDPSYKMIARAEKRSVPGVTFVRGTIQDLESLGIFDGIVASMVLPFVDNVENYFERFSTVLRPGGSLAFAAFNPRFVTDQLGAKGFFFLDECGCLRMDLDGRSIPVHTRSAEDYKKMLARAGFREIAAYSAPYSEDQGLSADRFLVLSCKKGS